MSESTTFRPRSSKGWLWLALLGFMLILLTTFPALITPDEPLSGVSIPGLLIGWGIGIPCLLLAFWFPSMRYELQPEELVLIYGPLKLYRVPYKDIKKMTWQDLQISLLSSFRLPGFALFTVPYGDEGSVKMVSTSAANRILLIKTAKETYGITPADEEGFIAVMKERIRS
ncbi:MAG: hypothetical protein EHM41_05690 [Chloroflexi bacterium]|nr:MAG: hypothetical protein EHM41_05690 [Chloroflexota bacterium]